MIYRISAGGNYFEAFLQGSDEADLESLWNEMISQLGLEPYDEEATQQWKESWTQRRYYALLALYKTLTGQKPTTHGYNATRVFVEYLKSKGFTEVLIAEYGRE